MSHVQTNKRYRVISGSKGPASPNVGKYVTALFMFTDREPHSLWGNIWRVKAVIGEMLVDGHGELMPEANMAEDWLEEDLEDPKADLRVTEKDIETI